MIETFQKNFNSLWVFVRNGRQNLSESYFIPWQLAHLYSPEEIEK
jgi:hypothetical protein